VRHLDLFFPLPNDKGHALGIIGTFHKVSPRYRVLSINGGAYSLHQAYSVALADGRVVIARIARRFMPRLKTESEVATMEYIRTYTSIPVPTVYFYDSNPYNRLGGEYIIMSKVRPAINFLTIM
jgi:hypothetical protein